MTRGVIRKQQPVGVILAGGPGIRIGGGKPGVALRGESLISYPLRTMRQVLSDVAVIAKAEIVLPQLEGAMVHPLLGVCEALALAGGRPVLACAVDMPFVTAELLTALAGAANGTSSAVLASWRGVARPLLGCYAPAAAPVLARAAADGVSLEEAVSALDPALVEVEDAFELFDVDTPDDLLQAAAMLDVRGPRLSRT
jgi:molybdopterin-guanine dinucleotide biosynthesis protein A